MKRGRALFPLLGMLAVLVAPTCSCLFPPEQSSLSPALTNSVPRPRALRNDAHAPDTVEVSLTAGVHKLQLAPGRPPSTAFAYNGSVPGPTLIANEGDHVIIHFKNDLPEATTVHWHGLHIPADQDGGPTDAVQAGATHDYVFDLPEGSAGTYWYHPHTDRKAAEQTNMGLFGAIIVRAKRNPLPAEIADELLVLNDNRFDDSGAISAETMNDRMNGRQGDVLFVNGVVHPTMTLRPGEVRRLRILNASAGRFYLLSVPNHELLQVGSSGGLFGRPLRKRELLVVPGERVEVLLRATAPPGTKTELQTLPYDRGFMTIDGAAREASEPVALLSIVYTSEPPVATPAIPDTLRPIEPLDTAGAIARTLVLSEKDMSFMIDGRTFDPKRVDVHAKLGATEVWTVRNDSDMAHPFHLHGFQFQILDRNGATEPVVAWNDTVNVPKKGSVRFAVKLDLPGMRMYHCHILEHEDLGMMGTLQVE